MPVLAGSLVLGQNQECFGACFSPSQSLDGSIAALRVWNRVRTQAGPSSFAGPTFTFHHSGHRDDSL
jgi:hypothetical protein